MSQANKNLITNEQADAELSAQFEKWLKGTCEPFDDWKFDGENFIVFVQGSEPEIYEPALVRELVGDGI